jgi:hypothetical protein
VKLKDPQSIQILRDNPVTDDEGNESSLLRADGISINNDIFVPAIGAYLLANCLVRSDGINPMSQAKPISFLTVAVCGGRTDELDSVVRLMTGVKYAGKPEATTRVAEWIGLHGSGGIMWKTWDQREVTSVGPNDQPIKKMERTQVIGILMDDNLVTDLVFPTMRAQEERKAARNSGFLAFIGKTRPSLEYQTEKVQPERLMQASARWYLGHELSSFNGDDDNGGDDNGGARRTRRQRGQDQAG